LETVKAVKINEKADKNATFHGGLDKFPNDGSYAQNYRIFLFTFTNLWSAFRHRLRYTIAAKF